MSETPKDELDGPLIQIQVDLRARRFDRTTNDWRPFYVAAGTQFTVVKKGDTIDVQATQSIRSEGDG
jgi:hypothetical protein